MFCGTFGWKRRGYQQPKKRKPNPYFYESNEILRRSSIFPKTREKKGKCGYFLLFFRANMTTVVTIMIVAVAVIRYVFNGDSSAVDVDGVSPLGAPPV